ncbi:MAG TPA: hypothetical protein VHX86_19715 [Tepidisphaeraceae bacterium]|jgi:hypothetical protein|nr:hypothetical protein [Tepidisphaeraceae bacterium]
MSLQPDLRKRLEKVLSTVDDQGSLGSRLKGDAARLWQRTSKFISMNLIGQQVDADALELACYALQLPPRQGKGLISGRLGRTNLRDRCEQAAELLVSLVGSDVEESLLDRTTRLIHEVPHRSPVIDEAKLMADALNLEDFGVIGLIIQAIQLGLQGEGVGDLATASEKREDYGYWEARIKDGFHFETVRAIAVKRLATSRKVAKMLADELKEDQP